MAKKIAMKHYFLRAIANVTRYGDTDIFLFPIENHIFYDRQAKTINLLSQINKTFRSALSTHPPSNEGALSPVSYTGFRWATQLDPLWNLYFLSLVLSIAEDIESQRISKADECVFSYRYAWDEGQATIFDPSYNWRRFMEQSLKKAHAYPFVVICDISEFYTRLWHHRLENALAHINNKTDTHKKIMKFLANFSYTNSFGLPIGGPAARILSELVLNQIDKLLKLEGVIFCRYSDDYHLFADSMEDGFAKLLLLTERLQRTQGLQIQKSKTRIMSSSEFISTSPLRLDDHDAPTDGQPSTLEQKARSLLQFSIRFDPYSPNATEDYDNLKKDLERYDVISLLQAELAKSRIHIALARKIVNVIGHLRPIQRDQAVISLVENAGLLYPIFSCVLMMVNQIFDELTRDTQETVVGLLLSLLQSNSHILKVDIVIAFAVRILARQHSAGVQEALVQVYNRPQSPPLVRRYVILAMAQQGAWIWLSDRRTLFRAMSPSERRSFILASYSLAGCGNSGGFWHRMASGGVLGGQVTVGRR